MAKRILTGIAFIALIVLAMYLPGKADASYLSGRVSMIVFFLGVFLGSRDTSDFTFGFAFTTLYLLLDVKVRGWSKEIEGVAFSIPILAFVAIMFLAGVCFGYSTGGIRQWSHRIAKSDTGKRILSGIVTICLCVISVYLLIGGHASCLAARIVVSVFFLGIFLAHRDTYPLILGLAYAPLSFLFDMATRGWKEEIDGVTFSVQLFGAYAIMLVAGAYFGYATRGLRQWIHRR